MQSQSTKQRQRAKLPGIDVRHARSCAGDDACSCTPSYRAWVYSKRDGKKIRKTFTGPGALAAAKAWRTDALHALGRGKLRAPTPLTVREAAEAWLAGAKDGTVRNRNGKVYKPSAIRGYERGLRKRVLPELGGRRLSDVRRIDVQDFADRLLAEGLAPSTIQNTIDPLRAIYRRALQREQVAINPTADLELPRAEGRRERIASPTEAAELLEVMYEEDRAVWATAMYAGLRRGELRGLRWSDVDVKGREVHVRRGWDDEEGEIDGKSDAADRKVPILAVLAPVLAAHKLRTHRDGDQLVFGVTPSDPFEPSTVRRRALAAWDRENDRRKEGDDEAELLEPIGLHEARHTFASILIAAGVNAKAICDAMGHASITMTFDHYGHLMPNGRAEAARLVDNWLERETGGQPLRAVE